MSIRNSYQHELSQKLNYFANWLPNRPLKIGDVGPIEKRHFVYEYNLASKSPELFKTRPSDSPFDIQYYTEGSAKIEFLSDSSLPDINPLVKSKQSIKIKFENEKSILFEAKGAIIKRVEAGNLLRQRLITLFLENEWQLDLTIVTEIVEVEIATIIITNKANAEVVLRSDNEIPVTGTDLLTVNASLAVEDKSSTELCMVGVSKVVPLFRLSRLRKKLFQNKLGWDSSLYSKEESDFDFEIIEAEKYE